LLSARDAMLETKQLRIFKTIVEVGSFTGAGEHLDLSQPAISQQMRALEEQIGVPLLVRSGRNTRPTPAGEVLLQCARQVLEKLELAQRILAEHGDGRAGVVRVGTPEPACNYLLPPVLTELKRRIPKAEIRVVSGHPPTTLARLHGGEVDVAFLPLPIDSERLRITEIGHDELVAIVPPAHPWIGRPHVAARDFEDEPLILYDRQSPITDRTLACLLDEGVFPRVAVEVDHLEALKDLVRMGVGVGVVPRWSALRELAAGALSAVRVASPRMMRLWGLCHLDGSQQSGAMRALLEVCAATLPVRLAQGTVTTHEGERPKARLSG
jgi:LysR family transcriptional regulator, low CO2-responsive transcriptional regulator